MDKNREYFIIENHSIIKKVRIIKFIGGFYTISKAPQSICAYIQAEFIPPIQMSPGPPVQGKTSMEQSG